MALADERQSLGRLSSFPSEIISARSNDVIASVPADDTSKAPLNCTSSPTEKGRLRSGNKKDEIKISSSDSSDIIK